MQIRFDEYEYGNFYSILDIHYTKYDGYGKRTEVRINRSDNKLKDKEYVMEGWLDIPSIINQLLYEKNIDYDFEDEEEW